MVKFENLTKIYPPDIVGVRDINLHIAPREFVSIVGQSGTGKSTLVRLLIAQEAPTEGQIIVGGWDITNIGKSQIPVLRRQVGVVFQEFNLLQKKTVFENIAFAAIVCGIMGSKIREIVPKALAIVGMEDKADRYPNQLSGGEQQRVAIARSLVHKPKLLIADEPTGNLDSFNTREIIDILKRINGFGTTVILVTHNRETVNSLKKRVITMKGGEVVSDKKSSRYVI